MVWSIFVIFENGKLLDIVVNVLVLVLDGFSLMVGVIGMYIVSVLFYFFIFLGLGEVVVFILILVLFVDLMGIMR